MWPLLRPCLPILIGISMLEGALNIFIPVVALRLERQSTPTDIVGVITSAYYIGFLLGSVYSNRRIARVGHIRAFAIFAALAANAALAHIFWSNPWFWTGLRTIIGYSMAGLFLAAESWLNERAPSSHRSRIFSVYTTMVWAATGIGPLALNIPDPTGIILFVLTAMVMSLALLPVATMRAGNPEISKQKFFGLRRLAKISPAGVAACLTSGLVNAALFGLMPIYTEKRGISQSELSLILSLVVVAALFSQVPVGSLADRVGRRPVILTVGLVGGAISLVTTLLAPTSFELLFGLTFVMLLFTSTLYGLGVSQTSDYVERKDFVAASGGLLFVWGLGASIGPVLAAQFMSTIGPEGLFLFISCILGGLSVLILIRMAQRRALPRAAQQHYVSVPVTQSQGLGATQLDPRAEDSAEPGLPFNPADAKSG